MKKTLNDRTLLQKDLFEDLNNETSNNEDSNNKKNNVHEILRNNSLKHFFLEKLVYEKICDSITKIRNEVKPSNDESIDKMLRDKIRDIQKDVSNNKGIITINRYSITKDEYFEIINKILHKGMSDTASKYE